MFIAIGDHIRKRRRRRRKTLGGQFNVTPQGIKKRRVS
jgi:hypothetical protein